MGREGESQGAGSPGVPGEEPPDCRLERLPSYSPDLNPVEVGWSWLKYGKLSNFVPTDVSHLDELLLEHLIALKCDPGLLRRLWDESDLSFPTHNVRHPGQPADQ